MFDAVIDDPCNVVIINLPGKGLAGQRSAMIVVAQRAGSTAAPPAKMTEIAMVVIAGRTRRPERTMSAVGSEGWRSDHRQIQGSDGGGAIDAVRRSARSGVRP